MTDDSAAHISEEVKGAARAAPIAILVGVGATAGLGWLLLIATSFVITSVGDLLATDLPLPMGQVFLDVLGKRGMLSIWSLIIIVQVISLTFNHHNSSRNTELFSMSPVLLRVLMPPVSSTHLREITHCQDRGTGRP